ncbi:MAG: hypothetical protein H6867_08755 [Rhodospirillales bacterium]|nr:hypothetical protein [Rhodospirillales bacterium]MCB9995644.1 hypothetical protein [Rhodospirillales bacterium]
MTGYAAMDREDGTNPLCDIDPTCRHLTQNEIKAAKTVFADQIDYRHVKLFNRMNFVTGALFMAKMQAPNGNIYHSKDPPTPDYTESGAQLSGFMHEMTHVWQRALNRNMLAGAFHAYKNAGYDYSEAYDYEKDWETKPFTELGIEQQAEIIEDYIYDRAFYEKTYAELPELSYATTCQEIRKFESYLKDSVPVTPVEKCDTTPPPHFRMHRWY